MNFTSPFRTCSIFLILAAMAFGQNASSNPQDCSKVPDHAKLKAALTAAVKEGKDANGGLGNQE